MESKTFLIVYAFGNVVLCSLLTRMAGPFTFVPALTCVVMMSVMAYPFFTVRSWILIVMLAGGFVLSILLEEWGFLPMTWEVKNGLLISHAGALTLQGNPALALLISARLATIVIAGVIAARIYRTGRDARLQLVTQAWHLRQLLPQSHTTG